jgi:hypothetical protein
MDTSKPSHVRQLFPVDSLPLTPSPSPPRRKIAVAVRRRFLTPHPPVPLHQLMSEMSLVGSSERKRKQTSPRKFTVGPKRKAPSSGVDRSPPLSEPVQKSKKKSQRPDLVHPHHQTKLLVPFVVKAGDRLIKNLFPSQTITMQKNEYGLYVYEGFVLDKKSVVGKYLGDGQVTPLTDEDFEKAKELKIII